MAYNNKNTTNLYGKLNVANDITAETNILLNDKLESTRPIDNTVMIDGSLNVNNLFTVDANTGLVQVANDILIYGVLTAYSINFNDYITFGNYVTIYANSGTQVWQDGSNIVTVNGKTGNITASGTGSFGTTSTSELQITNPYYAIGATTYNAGTSQRGQVQVPDGNSSIIVLNSLVTSTSFVHAIVCSAGTSQAVTSVVPSSGQFQINLSGTVGNRLVNWFIVN